MTDSPSPEAIKAIVQDFMVKHPKMSLAINQEASAPNISLMHYAMEGHRRILIGTRKAFRKYDLMKKNSNVSFMVVDEGLNPLRSVSGQGIATELSDFQMDFAYALFKKENIAKWYVEGSDDFAMFEIILTSLRYLDATSGSLQILDVPVEAPKEIPVVI